MTGLAGEPHLRLPSFLWVTAFVGFMLFQSALTGFCPMEIILRAVGVKNAYTDCINPLKLYEALAAGRPVVAPPIRTLRDFAPVVTLAEGTDEWESALESALSAAATAPDVRAARLAMARAHDWEAIVRRLAADLRPTAPHDRPAA